MRDEDQITAKQYAIYARKSSDESTGKQYKSIDDQLQFCHELAEREGITVPEKYIFREAASAKTANNRPIFTQLLNLVRAGKIDGIISWHPDRLSRNMLEAGTIIDLIDSGKIADLKFCTHHFDNTAAGKMMLGILFAISKEYSDRLSVNVSRGHGTNLDEGKSQGSHKWGYVRNEDGYYDPHPEHYDIVAECWHKRLRGDSFTMILAWLEKMDCTRQVEAKDAEGNRIINTYTIGRSGLTRIFRDPFYFGVLRQMKDKKIEFKTMQDYYPDFRPMITKEEWEAVQLMGRSKVKLNKKQRFPFRDNIIRCTCGATCYPTTGQSDKLYLYIVCRNGALHRTTPKWGTYRMRSKIVIEAIADSLKKNFKPTKQNFERYVSTIKRAIENDLTDSRKRRANITKKKADAEKKLEELILKVFGEKMDEAEDAVYERRKFKLQSEIKQYKEDLKKLEESTLLSSFNYEEFSNFLRNADRYWKKADADQKHALARFLFSNITVGHGKVLELAYKPLIKDLFVLDGGPGGS